MFNVQVMPENGTPCWPDDLRYLKDILSEDKVSDIKRYLGIKLQKISQRYEK